MFCPNCGKEVPAGSKFCPGCGKASGTVPNAPNTASGSAEPQANPNDAEQNKGMAVLAYILFFIPLLAGTHKTSDFVKYHTNQGIVLVIFCIAFGIVTGILSAILVAIATASFSLGLLMAIPTLFGLLWLIPILLCILGIVNAATGKMKPLPVIGKFTILK
jgi:uncharacterized membrane protein